MSSATAPRLQAAASSLRAATAAFSGFLGRLPGHQAMLARPGQWSPAAHGLHVALTDEVFAMVLAGTAPLTVDDGPSDFAGDAWSLAAPPRAIAPSVLVPALDVTPAVAAARLAEASAGLAAAIELADTQTVARRVHLPWARVSVLQMCEWSAGHTLRHLSQVARELQQAAAREHQA